MKISVVIPVFNEEACLEELWKRLGPVLRGTGLDFEVILVDDASEDRTWNLIQDLHHRELRIKGIRLAQQQGHQIAFFTGLSSAQGEAVIGMDGDLQHPPEKIPQLIQGWHEGFDLVYGFKTGQPGRNFFKKFLNQSFHRIFSLRMGNALHPETSDFQILDRTLAKKVAASWRPPVFLRCWIHFLAKKRKGVPFRAEKRYSGHSKQRFIPLFMIGLRSFLFFPADCKPGQPDFPLPPIAERIG